MFWFRKRKQKKKENEWVFEYNKPICPECGNDRRVGMINKKWYCFEHNKELGSNSSAD